MTLISTVVTSTVYLGQNNVGNALTIGAKGEIAPSTYGAAGIVAGTASATITNHGTVFGGYGGKTGYAAGGNAIQITHGGVLVNAGLIAGGTSGLYSYHAGGDGVVGADVTLKNTGVISGGGVAFVNDNGDPGGVGVDLVGSHVTNQGTIAGGAGGYFGGMGGNAVVLSGGALSNSGKIEGGLGGFGSYNPAAGGNAISVSLSASINNSGIIVGGTGGVTRSSNLHHPGYLGGPGGVGVDLGTGILSNTGTITGGGGGGGGYGVSVAGGRVVNAGVITGGAGGQAYGYGHIAGGGSGGAGILLNGGSLENTGAITGGQGSYYGNGGYGAYLRGGTLTNTGKISGGNKSAGQDSAGGIGVLVQGGTLSNLGTITAGPAANYGNGQYGPQPDAVRFGKTTATLIDHAGAVFNGTVAANGVNDTLLLAGGKQGTLSGLGSQFTGFTTVTEAAHALWTVAGDATLAAGSTVNADGLLSFAANVSGAGTLAIGTDADLKITGTLTAAQVVFGAGGNEALVLGAPAATTGTLSGFGHSDRIDLVNLLANGVSFANGTLTLLEGTATVATLTLAGSYTTADFGVISDGNHGTDIVFTGTAASLPDAATSQAALPSFGNPADLLYGFIDHWHAIA